MTAFQQKKAAKHPFVPDLPEGFFLPAGSSFPDGCPTPAGHSVPAGSSFPDGRLSPAGRSVPAGSAERPLSAVPGGLRTAAGEVRVLLHCCCAPCSTAILEWMVGAGLRPGVFFSNSNIVPFEEYEHRKAELVRYAASHGLEVIDDEYDHGAWLAFVRRLEKPSASEAGSTAPAPETSSAAPAPADVLIAPAPGAFSLAPAPETSSVAPAPADVLIAPAPGAFSLAPAPETVPVRIADMPERGPRCLECFKFRLLRAARYAAGHGYGVLTTTLASSRWKDLAQVDEAGRFACTLVNARPEPLSPTASSGNPSSVSSRKESDDPSCPDSSPEKLLKERSGGRSWDRPAVQVVWWNQNWRKGSLQDRRSCLIRELGLYNQPWCGCEFSSARDAKQQTRPRSFDIR